MTIRSTVRERDVACHENAADNHQQLETKLGNCFTTILLKIV